MYEFFIYSFYQQAFHRGIEGEETQCPVLLWQTRELGIFVVCMTKWWCSMCNNKANQRDSFQAPMRRVWRMGCKWQLSMAGCTVTGALGSSLALPSTILKQPVPSSTRQVVLHTRPQNHNALHMLYLQALLTLATLSSLPRIRMNNNNSPNLYYFIFNLLR